MSNYKKDYLLYAALFNTCRAIGVLPVVRNVHDEKCQHFGGPGRGCFSVTLSSRVVTALQLVVVLLCAQSTCPDVIHVDTNFYLWLQNVISAVTSLTLVLCCSSTTTVKYLNLACKTYNLPSTTGKHFPVSLFCILIVYPFVPLVYTVATWVYSMKFDEPFYTFIRYYFYIPVSAVEVVITTCCFIADRAYRDVNDRLRKLLDLSFKTSALNAVKDILAEYIVVCKFVRCLAGVFSPHFLNSFAYLILKMIFFTVVAIELIKTERHIVLLSYVFYAAYLIFRLLIICFSCQNILREIAETTHILHRLRVKWVFSITEDQSKLLDTYEQLISSSGVEFTACGLFPINTQQVVSVLGLIVTYGLVALQT